MFLPPPWRKALLTLHVATAVGWLGVDAVLLTLGIAGQAGADPAIVYPAAGLIGLVLFAPLSVLVWLIGAVNGLLTTWGVFRYWWVIAKLAITTVMVGLVLVVLTPKLQAAADLGAALPARTRLELVIAPSVSTTLLLVATALSSYKPWGRSASGREPRRPLAGALNGGRTGTAARRTSPS